jgi:hypothetical protein
MKGPLLFHRYQRLIFASIFQVYHQTNSAAEFVSEARRLEKKPSSCVHQRNFWVVGYLEANLYLYVSVKL